MRMLIGLLFVFFYSKANAGINIKVKMPGGEIKTYEGRTGTKFVLGAFECEINSDAGKTKENIEIESAVVLCRELKREVWFDHSHVCFVGSAFKSVNKELEKFPYGLMDMKTVKDYTFTHECK